MLQAPGVAADLGNLEEVARARLRSLEDQEVIPRIWERDHTVWRDDPTEITDRLGWLDAPARGRELAQDLLALAREVSDEGLTHAVLLGMGGSSLAPEVFGRTLGVASGSLDLRILDTTHPNAIAALEDELPLDRTLFVVSSKSGTTIETRSHMAYFLERTGDPSRFVAVTDPGTPLERDATEAGFRRVVAAQPDVGGRYSALTAFGLLPAALIGADVGELLDEAEAAVRACGPDVAAEDNPAALLGVVIAEAALSGRDKLTLSLPVEPLGAWIEQLVAESTGKDGRGIVPVDLEPEGQPDVYGTDRVFAGRSSKGPGITLSLDPGDLGGGMVVWEMATAIAGHVLGIHPFDQPDVQAAKDRTNSVLEGGEIPEEPYGDIDALLGRVEPGDYVAIQAFATPREERWEALQVVRSRIRDTLRVATTLGYGPRYLHSTGQLHKGGPGTGVFVQVLEEPTRDRDIPGRPFTFGSLIEAQAAGDLAALRDRERRVARVQMDDLLAWRGTGRLGGT